MIANYKKISFVQVIGVKVKYSQASFTDLEKNLNFLVSVLESNDGYIFFILDMYKYYFITDFPSLTLDAYNLTYHKATYFLRAKKNGGHLWLFHTFKY